jgi:hypothetical protein
MKETKYRIKRKEKMENIYILNKEIRIIVENQSLPILTHASSIISEHCQKKTININQNILAKEWGR